MSAWLSPSHPPGQHTSSLATRHLGTFWASRPNKTQQEAETTTLLPTPFRRMLESQSPSDPVMHTIITAGTDTIHTFAHRGTRYQGSRRLIRWGVNTCIRSTLGREHSSACRHLTVAVCLCRIQIRSGLRTGHHTHVGRGRTVVARLGRMRRLCHRWAMGGIDLVVIVGRCVVRLCEIVPGPKRC
jgi:hypothetical protein